jgi:probable rRNA maturation factor
MIEVINRQRRHPIDRSKWSGFAETVLREAGSQNQCATIVFASERLVRNLNRRFRGRDAPTDVLSFPSGAAEFEEPTLGDVIISVPRAEAQAAEHGLDFDRELAQLILHGLLHLCGYDHERDDGRMNRLELRLRRRLGI